MRAGIATVQHTLTAEASTVLKRAIADAQQRGHAQVTPLHVASSLLTAPSSMLQQACIQSHRHVPHPLQCRALDLCFNVALERLPATIQQQQQQQHSTSPQSSSLSNALVAALKRAQAHQRRGCPEQQQVPLLAVKVEMEQLVISILDDPSVSRVMREAGFSSTRAKNSLETSCFSSSNINSNPLDDIRSRINRDQQQQQQQQKLQNPQLSGASTFHSRSSMLPQPRSSQDAQSAMAILARARKQRNPVLIGDDLSTSFVLKEIWKTIRQQDQPPHLKNARVLFVEKGFGSCAEITQRWILQISKAEEESSIHPVVVFLGNLSWCIHQSPVIVSSVLGELAKIITRAEGKRLWLVSSSSSQLYMRFVAQHPSMETRLGFQPLPVSVPSIRPRFSPGDSQPSRTFPKMLFRIPDDEEQLSCCTDCTAKFEHESLTLLQEQRTESVSSSGDSLPNWMKNRSNTEIVTPQPPILQTQEFVRDLRRKWNRNCQTLHNSLKTTLPNLTDCSSSSGQSSPEGKLASSWLSLSTITEAEAPPSLSLGLSSTGLNFDHRSKKSKLTTDLVLGTPNSTDAMKFHQQRLEDSSGCTRRSSAEEDMTGFVKKVFKGMSDKVPWQTDAAGKVASTVARCWGRERKRARMIFAGADFMGKRKVAKALAEEVYGAGNNLLLLSLNPQDRKTPRRLLWEAEATEHQEICRGKTVTDRIADAVKSKPFSVVLLEDLEEADVGVKKTLMKSLERGRIQHSSGSEVGIGNAIVILTTKSSGKKSDLEEKLECVEGSEIRVTVEKRIDSGDESCPGRNKCEVSVVDCEGGLLIREEVKCVGEKRKEGLSSWGDKLEGLMLLNRSRKKMAIDLNLGLSSCESWGGAQGGDEDGGGGMFDEVVEFGEVEVGVMADVVMERVERLACGYRVCVEMDLKVVEKMVAAVWGGSGGGLERWFKEMVEDVVIARCDGTPGDCWTVRLVG